MSNDQHTFRASLQLLNHYKFEVDFGEMGQLYTDEPPPLGTGQGPNPGTLLITAIANCLAASLLFALRKFHHDPGQLRADVIGSMQRQDGRWRVSQVKVSLYLQKPIADPSQLQRALAQFEDFCIVTQSVRQGIPVQVSVLDADQQLIHQA